ncbi:MAG: hypothetical protein LLG15_09625 [Betaproteobacteria bacterium]|nr:hypothetical protein [Betaproteobacteria bacterium]
MMRLATILFTYVLWSVAPTAVADQNRTPTEYEKVDTFVNEALGLPVVESLANLRKIGLVTREKVRVIPNKHDPKQDDEIRILQFDGLAIKAYFPARNYGHGIIAGVTVTKPQWKLRHGLNVGVMAKAVESVLGKPDERDSDRMMYCGDVVCGTFFLHGNRVIRVVFEGGVD